MLDYCIVYKDTNKEKFKFISNINKNKITYTKKIFNGIKYVKKNWNRLDEYNDSIVHNKRYILKPDRSVDLYMRVAFFLKKEGHRTPKPSKIYNPITGEEIDNYFVIDGKKWFIVKMKEVLIEDKFTVIKKGKNDKNTTVEKLIINYFIKPYKYQNVYIHHIYILLDFDTDFMVIRCKNKSDCLDLYNTLKEIVVEYNLTNILFFGNPAGYNLPKLVSKMQDGLGITKTFPYL